MGEVAPSPDTCLVCLPGSYSLDPGQQGCQACPSAGADCPGGAAIVPLPGWWHSAVESVQMHRCPNVEACQGDRAALRACTEDAICRSTNSSYNVLQCAAAYTGNVCGRILVFGLCVPLVALLCLGLPTVIVYVTVSNRNNLDDTGFRRSWGFLAQSYRPGFCWWEAAETTETAVLVAISEFGVNVGPFYQCLLMAAVLVLIIYLRLGVKPYVHQQTGKAMVHNTLCLLLTTMVGQSFLLYGPVTPGAAYGLAMGAILLAVNLVFVCSVLWQLLRLIDWPALSAAFSKSIRTVCRRLQHLGVSVHRVRMRVVRSSAPAMGRQSN
uniref:TRP C-terminal domain-containing protein n=1 Tax=Tetradesmus obliquus TaxID=3088 RepID=A0A383VT78_TETOB|eukprot:jgi/Sobl393_1/5139/SZX67972.1